MSDDQQTTGNESSQSQGNQNQMPEWVSDPARAWEHIQELRTENQTRRTNSQDVMQRLEQLSQTVSSLVPQEAEAEPEQFDNPLDAVTARLDRLQDIIEQERQMRVQAELNATRTTLASEFGLPEVIAARIQGDTVDAMRADAEALAQVFNASTQAQQNQQQDTPLTPDMLAAQRYRSTTGLPSGQASANQDAARRTRYFNR